MDGVINGRNVTNGLVFRSLLCTRCHRAFLVNLGQVEQIVSHSGSTQLLIKQCHESLPVSRSNMAQVRAAIKRGEC